MNELGTLHYICKDNNQPYRQVTSMHQVIPCKKTEESFTRPAKTQAAAIWQVTLLIFGATIISIKPAYASSTVWVKCGRDYIIGLNERNMTFTLNDDYYIRNGMLQVAGRWFHGKALFTPHKVEFTFTHALQRGDTGVILKDRVEISRIDLHYQRYVSKKTGNSEWTSESAGFNPTGLCIKIKEPSVKNQI
jgi:hypothetical protein